MNCLCFDQNNKFIGCTNEVGAIYIFSIAGIMRFLNEKEEKNKNYKKKEDIPRNSKSLLGKIEGFLNIKSEFIGIWK